MTVQVTSGFPKQFSSYLAVTKAGGYRHLKQDRSCPPAARKPHHSAQASVQWVGSCAAQIFCAWCTLDVSHLCPFSPPVAGGSIEITAPGGFETMGFIQRSACTSTALNVIARTRIKPSNILNHCLGTAKPKPNCGS